MCVCAFVILFFFLLFVVMVSSPRKCPGVEGKVCGCFLPSKEYNPHRYCVACRGKSCTPDDRCEECHDWPHERCKSVANYVEKLSLQCERKKDRKTKSSSSSSFSGFSFSTLVPLGQLPSPAGSGVVTTLAFSCVICVVMYAVAGPAVTAAPIVLMPSVMPVEPSLKLRCVTDPKERELMMLHFEDWWASRKSSPRRVHLQLRNHS